jgi:hypothetical protein
VRVVQVGVALNFHFDFYPFTPLLVTFSTGNLDYRDSELNPCYEVLSRLWIFACPFSNLERIFAPVSWPGTPLMARPRGLKVCKASSRPLASQ